MTSAEMATVHTFHMERENELRLEVDYNVKVQVKLVNGTAEIFGCEIAKDVPYTFSGRKLAVFTWHGAVVEVTGEADSYVADETPMRQFVNTHSILEARRSACHEAGASGQGPVTMVVGPTDSGKSSLCTLLVNYAVRQGWAPLLVDLDVGQGMFTVPGTIAATVVERPIHPVEGVALDAPLVYYLGSASPGENPEHYEHLVGRMAEVLQQRDLSGEKGGAHRAAGTFINTMGWVDGPGYQLLVNSARTLKVDVILVLGQDKLHAELEKEFRKDGNKVEVVKLSKSGGVVTRPTAFRKTARQARTQEYFYGVEDDLRVTTLTASFDELAVFRVGGVYRAPASALPLGAEPVANPMRLQPVQWSRELVNSILAVSHASKQEDILGTNVAGFVWVTDVDMAKGRIAYHTPCGGALPSVNLLAGDLKFCA